MLESYLCAMFYKWLFLLGIFPFSLLAQTRQTTQLYQENALWGLKENSPITPAVYDTLYSVAGTNYYIATKHGKGHNSTGVITSKGKSIIPFNYWQVTFSNNNFIVSKWEHKTLTQGVISPSNKVLLNLRFNQVKSSSNFWIVKSLNNDLQLYSIEGRLVKTLDADSISTTENKQYMLTHKQGKIGLLGADGNEIFSPRFKQIINKNGRWTTLEFPKWSLISKKDTSIIYADTVKSWNGKQSFIGIGGIFFIITKNEQISQNYESIKAATPSLAIASKNNLYGVVTNFGKERLPISFGKIYYSNGYFYTRNNHKWSVYDSVGRKKSVFKYDSIGTISNGLFAIKRKGKWGFMNRDGKEVIHCIYDSTANFKKGKAIITYFGASGIIDLDGNWIVKPQSSELVDFSYNFYIAKKDGRYHLKNYNNELIYFTNNKLIFKDETIFEIRDGYTNRISSLGTFTKNKDSGKKESNSWQIIKIGDKYGFEDLQGVLKITYRYDSLLLFSEGLAAFKLREKWGFINASEEIIIQPIYNKVAPFIDKLSVVTQNNKSGLVSIEGRSVLKPKFDSISYINNSLWQVKENGLQGIYNSRGAIIIQPKFDKILFINESLIIVTKNKIYGVRDSKGKSILPRVYDFIGYDSDNTTLILKKNPN